MKVSEKGITLMEFVKGAEDVTAADAAEALGVSISSITGTFNSIVKKGLGERVQAEIELPDGTHKAVKFLKLTDEGMTFENAVEDEA